MASFSAAIYLFCILVIAGPTAPFVAEAVSLRAQAPGRSRSAAASTGASPANVEEEEEDEDNLGEQGAPIAFPAPQTQPEPPAFTAQEVQNSVPSSEQSPPVATPQWSVGEVPVATPKPMPAAARELPTATAWQPFVMAEAPAAAPKLSMAAAPQPQRAVPQANEALFQFVPPQESKPSPAIATVPKVTHAPKVPMWIAKRRAEQADPAKDPWPPNDNTYSKCDPPCIQGRGICNDNVCFCRSPFTGSTCQHKISALYRASKAMAVGFSAFCILLGILLAKLVMTFAEAAVETRLAQFGTGKQRFEKWMPPEQEKGGKKAPKKQDAGA